MKSDKIKHTETKTAADYGRQVLEATGISVKSTERDCPRCHAVLVLNENEQCYECHNCGYIDCGDED